MCTVGVGGRFAAALEHCARHQDSISAVAASAGWGTMKMPRRERKEVSLGSSWGQNVWGDRAILYRFSQCLR